MPSFGEGLNDQINSSVGDIPSIDTASLSSFSGTDLSTDMNPNSVIAKVKL